MLCGSARFCGCQMTTISNGNGPIMGSTPQIDVTGMGLTEIPWEFTIDEIWAANVVAVAQSRIVTPWTAVTFTSPWGNYGGEWAPVMYRKIGDIVYLRGLMAGTGAVVGATAFTLPVGFRPHAQLMFVAEHGSIQHGATVVATDGTVAPIHGVVDGNMGYWSVSNIKFSIPYTAFI